MCIYNIINQISTTVWARSLTTTERSSSRLTSWPVFADLEAIKLMVSGLLFICTTWNVLKCKLNHIWKRFDWIYLIVGIHWDDFIVLPDTQLSSLISGPVWWELINLLLEWQMEKYNKLHGWECGEIAGPHSHLGSSLRGNCLKFYRINI